MSEVAAAPSYAQLLASELRDQREALTARWVRTLQEQLRIDARDVLPSEELLDHIPAVLGRIADFVEDPSRGLLEAMVVEDLGRLAETRRRQGFGLQELLREYHILSEMMQEECERVASGLPDGSDPVEIASAVGRLKDAIHLLGAITARTFRAWDYRSVQEQTDVLNTYADMLAHELGNRLGAAETSVHLLRSGMELPRERREHLLELILRGIQGGLQTVQDVRALAAPVTREFGSSRSIALPLIVRELVRQTRVRAEAEGIDVRMESEIPEVRVRVGPVQLALSNILGNAVKYHRESGDDRWVSLSAHCSEDDARVELVVADNGPGIPAEFRDRVFDYRVRGDVSEEGSGLGLAIARDAVIRCGGTIEAGRSEAGGAAFTVRLPTLQPDADEE